MSFCLYQCFCCSFGWSQSKTQRFNCTQTDSRVCGLGFSTLWTSLNYLQVVDQDEISASQLLHKGQDMPEPKVFLPWFPCCEIPVPTAVSPCSVCSYPSAPAPRSPQPILTPLDSSRQLSPADGRGGCRRNAGGIRLSCFISCCLGQIPTLCQFLGASNCCSL